ncbi:MAG TPA: diacylglycerol kinase family lipid kinase [Bacillota bacterium]|nr:diacylglycerol kinase family lipid kinase [Bacillota bacterium]
MEALKTAVVVNPASANGTTARRWPEIAAFMESEGISFTAFMTEAPEHATELTRRALQDGCDLVVSVGGDGTHNEVMNGFFTAEGPVRPEAQLAFISMGTGSDLIKTLHIPKDPAAAVKQFRAARPRKVDVGRINFYNHRGERAIRYFINIAGLGLDGDTVDRVNRTSKALGGFISFLWGTIASLMLYRNQQMAISVDDEPVFEGPVTEVAVANGRYFGGGMFIAPHAVMDDGLFDVVILHNLSKLNLLVNLPKVYRGTHLDHPQIISVRGRKVVIETEALLNVDGEQPGRGPVEMDLLPLALQVRA